MFVGILLIQGCDQTIKDANKEFMPPAQGAIGEIILVMDSALWRGQLGVELKRTFHDLMPGLPQDERLFELHYISPFKLNNTLKTTKNMVFVTVLNDNSQENRILRSYFTSESLDMVRNDADLFMLTKQDDFAKGQEILHLFGRDLETLIKNIRENSDRIKNHFELIERKRLVNKLFKVENVEIRKELKTQHNFNIRVPYGYQLAANKDNFIWLRQLVYPEEKSIFIYYEPYRSPAIFNKDSIAGLREKVSYRFIRDVQNRNTFMTLQNEQYMPYFTREINFKGNYAYELRGLWKNSDISAGGPFVSYTLVDEKLERLYYIEGYVYHPSGDKRDWMREMDAILWSFGISDQSVE